MRTARGVLITSLILGAFVAFWLLNQRRTPATPSNSAARRDPAANWLTLE